MVSILKRWGMGGYSYHLQYLLILKRVPVSWQASMPGRRSHNHSPRIKYPKLRWWQQKKNPHSILSVPAHVTDKASRIKPEIETYCPDADSGQADAQKHIGDLHYLGTHGIKRDLILAYVWYSLAATGGNIEATRQLYPLIDELSPDQSDEAVRLLLDWEPGQCERDLNNAIFEGNE